MPTAEELQHTVELFSVPEAMQYTPPSALRDWPAGQGHMGKSAPGTTHEQSPPSNAQLGTLHCMLHLPSERASYEHPGAHSWLRGSGTGTDTVTEKVTE